MPKGSTGLYGHPQSTIVNAPPMPVGGNPRNSLGFLMMQALGKYAGTYRSADVPMSAEAASALGIPVKGAPTGAGMGKGDVVPSGSTRVSTR